MNIKKFLIFLIILLFLFSILKEKNRSETYRLENYIVQAGDTAWSIMIKNNFANKDIRELIYYIEQDNNINASYLQIGQEIKIRIYERD